MVYREIGVEKYITSSKGVRPSDFLLDCKDFIVVEKFVFISEEQGANSIYRLIKAGISSLDTFEYLRKKYFLEINGYLGLKDANSISIQYISIRRKNNEKLKRVYCFKKGWLVWQGNSNASLYKGIFNGNMFIIRLPLGPETLETLYEIKHALFLPNYFGHQRFGVSPPYNHVIALYLLKDDKEKVVDLLKRKSLRENSWENLFLKKDRIPIEIYSILLQSFQSYVFNKCLSEVLSNRKINEIENKYGVLPGYDIDSIPDKKWISKDHVICVKKTLKELNINKNILVKEKRFIKTRVRALTFPVKNLFYTTKPDLGKIILKVTLPPGSYASILIREFFKDNEEWLYRKCKTNIVCPYR